MKRVSTSYLAAEEGKCKICGRRFFPGMFVFDVELRDHKRATVHATCEKRLKKEAENGNTN